MSTHDPRKVLEALRNHLTVPESNIAFLLGAGTSCSVRVPVETGADSDQANAGATRPLIPNVAELTEICAKEIRKLDPDGESPRYAQGYDAIELEVRPTNRPTNIEDILSCVRRKIGAIGNTDTLAGLTAENLVAFEKTIRATIAAQVNPDPSSWPEKLPHEDFVRWIARVPRSHPVEIFTTNYDVLLETALEAERVPAFDGFVGCNRPFFSHDSLTRPESSPGSAWTRLWKVHGSINWRLDTVRGRPRVVRTDPHNEGEMILPSHHKYDESRKQPYSALLDRLTRVLERDDAILFVCGYSFSDEHINAIIFDALEAKRRPHVIGLQFGDPEPGSVIAERAMRFLNLMILGPSIAYIGGRRGAWRVNQAADADQIAKAFRLTPVAEGETSDGSGRLLLGDFAHFCNFLGDLTGPA
jgi:hypothetical protein